MVLVRLTLMQLPQGFAMREVRALDDWDQIMMAQFEDTTKLVPEGQRCLEEFVAEYSLVMIRFQNGLLSPVGASIKR